MNKATHNSIVYVIRSTQNEGIRTGLFFGSVQ